MDIILREYLTKERSRIDTGMSEKASLRAEGQVGVKAGLPGGRVWDRERAFQIGEELRGPRGGRRNHVMFQPLPKAHIA